MLPTDVLVRLGNSYYLTKWVARRVFRDWSMLCSELGLKHRIRVTHAGPISRLVVVSVWAEDSQARYAMAQFRRMAGLLPSVLD